MDDRSLIELVGRGDGMALTMLYDRYSKLVYSAALGVLRDPPSAEDVLQDVFLMIWHHPRRYLIDGDSLAGFLTVGARNRSIDVLRRRRPTDPVEDYLLASPFDLAHYAEQNLLHEKVRTFADVLSWESRRLLDMAFLEEMSHSEISAATGFPLGTVKSRIRSALLTLRLNLQTNRQAA